LSPIQREHPHGINERQKHKLVEVLRIECVFRRIWALVPASIWALIPEDLGTSSERSDGVDPDRSDATSWG